MITTNPFDVSEEDGDTLREECGVFGVWNADNAASFDALTPGAAGSGIAATRMMTPIRPMTATQPTRDNCPAGRRSDAIVI